MARQHCRCGIRIACGVDCGVCRCPLAGLRWRVGARGLPSQRAVSVFPNSPASAGPSNELAAVRFAVPLSEADSRQVRSHSALDRISAHRRLKRVLRTRPRPRLPAPSSWLRRPGSMARGLALLRHRRPPGRLQLPPSQVCFPSRCRMTREPAQHPPARRRSRRPKSPSRSPTSVRWPRRRPTGRSWPRRPAWRLHK